MRKQKGRKRKRKEQGKYGEVKWEKKRRGKKEEKGHAVNKNRAKKEGKQKMKESGKRATWEQG